MYFHDKLERWNYDPHTRGLRGGEQGMKGGEKTARAHSIDYTSHALRIRNDLASPINIRVLVC